MAYRARLLNVVGVEIRLVGSNPTDSANMEDQPDRRAGLASKAMGAVVPLEFRLLGLPPFSC